MGPFRMLLLAGSIAGSMIGGSYGLMRLEQAANRAPVAHPTDAHDTEHQPNVAAQTLTSSRPPIDTNVPTDLAERPEPPELSELPELPTLRALDLAAITEANLRHMPLEVGFRLGPLTFEPRTTAPCDDAAESGDTPCTRDLDESTSDASNEANETPATNPTRRTRQNHQTRRETRHPASRRSRPPSSPPPPRLHPNPGMHTILVARGMMARNETVRGSCYRYLTEVFDRAGHHGWRNRRVVYRAEREGPYADLGLVRPGDWLYIVNDPNRTPVGTHSVMFVGWQDQARGYARVISHGGGGSTSAGRERGYDISETYRIIRPIIRQ